MGWLICVVCRSSYVSAIRNSKQISIKQASAITLSACVVRSPYRMWHKGNNYSGWRERPTPDLLFSRQQDIRVIHVIHQICQDWPTVLSPVDRFVHLISGFQKYREFSKGYMERIWLSLANRSPTACEISNRDLRFSFRENGTRAFCGIPTTPNW